MPKPSVISAVLTAAVATTWSAGAAAQSDGGANNLPIIVTAPGGKIDDDDAIVLQREDLNRSGRPDLLQALTRDVAAISLQDAQGNPWQPNLIYRGFSASPLQGQAQGLAVYLDGGRFNQPFGDTVGFDLIPDAALRSITLLDTAPAYGLNALGGALVLETATGQSDPGLDASVTLGSYGKREASLAGGGTAGAFSYFGAAQWRREDGWRDNSPSELLNGYADFGYTGESAGLHVKIIGADTDLTGNGVAPVELLQARRQAVFSWPDTARSHYGRVSLHPWVDLGHSTRIEASIYRQRLKVDSLNGDFADIAACEDGADQLCLEGRDGEEPLTDRAGDSIPDLLGGGAYGVLNRGHYHTRSWGVLAQLIDERALGAGNNRLAVGFSHDSSQTDFSAETELGELTAQRSVVGLGPVLALDSGAIAPVSLAAATRYWGLFAADRLPLGGKLSAEIGLRYNWADIRLTDGIGTALNGQHHFERLNPGIEFDWSVTPALSLRAGYSEANRVPTPAELSCADAAAPCSLANFFIADPPLRQVVSRNWEMGASGEATSGGWTIHWLASAYRSTNSDDIQHVASQVRGRAYFRNVGATRRTGAELQVDARRGPLRVTLSYAFIDATFQSSFRLSSPANPGAAADGTIGVSAGDRIPGIPRHSVTFGADYSGKIGQRKLAFGADLVARSGQGLLGDESGLAPPVPGYMLVNLHASFELVPGVSLMGELRNVFDRRYATFGTFSDVSEVYLAEVSGATDPRAYGPGSPRRWSLGLHAAF